MVRKAQEAIQAVNSSSGKKATTKPRKNSDTASAPSEKEMQLLGMIASGGSPAHYASDSDSTPKVKALSSSSNAFDSPSTLRRDEKQQQMIRGSMKHKRSGSTVASTSPSSAAAATTSPTTAAPAPASGKSKFSTLVGRVKSELGEFKALHRRTESSSKIAPNVSEEAKSEGKASESKASESKPPDAASEVKPTAETKAPETPERFDVFCCSVVCFNLWKNAAMWTT